MTLVNAKITLGDKVFELGKDLISFSFSFAESKQKSKIQFTVLDKRNVIGTSLLTSSYQNGGLQALEKPSASTTPPESQTNSALGASETLSNSDNGTVTRGGKFTPEVTAFLDMIASVEAAPGQGLSRQGYFSNNGVPGSPGFFSEDSAKDGYPASAGTSYNVGRYQFLLGDYNDAKKADPTITNYLPPNQDKVAYYKLGYRGVLAPLKQGDIRKAIDKAAYEWASLPLINNPRGKYGQVQSGVTMDTLIAYYNTRLNYYKGLTPVSEQQASKPKDLATVSQTQSGDYQVVKLINASTQASFYGVNDGFDGQKTASGDTFRTNVDLTAAHNSLPFGSLVKVTWLTNNKSVVVRVNDRGNFVKLGRQIDLSAAAIRALSDATHNAETTGVITVKLELVTPSVTPGGSQKETSKEAVDQSIDVAKTTPPESQPKEFAYKGQQIFLEVSIDGGLTYACSSYIHQTTQVVGMNKNLLQITGVAASWTLDRVIKNSRYSNVTLKGLATAIAKQYNMELVMSEEGDFIENVSQVSLTDWKFLLYICERQGFNLRTIGKQIYIDKITVNAKTNSYIFNDKLQKRVLSLDVVDSATSESDFSNYQAGTVTNTVDPDSATFKKIDIKQSKTPSGKQLPPLVLGKNYSNPRPSDKKKKEFQLNISFLPTPQDLENITPDTQTFFDLSTETNFIAEKSWFIEEVAYAYSNGVFSCDLSAYVLLDLTSVTPGGATTDQPATATATPNDKGVGSMTPRTIRNPDGSTVTAFEQLNPHWRGTGGYTRYITRSGQAGGKISHLAGDPSQLVYDFTCYIGGNSVIPTPSPVSGIVTVVGGAFGRVGIKPDDGSREVQVLHMSNIRVKTGDRVLFGTILGNQNRVAGNSNTTGVHTHIQINEALLRRYITALLTGNFN